ncbi:RNA polymerase sigma factor [Streptomyces nojiriensis]
MNSPVPTSPQVLPHPAAPARAAADPFAEAAVLVRAARAGDVMALDDLIDLLTPYVTRVCRPIARDDTADAVQESLIAVFRGLDRLTDPTALYAWVRTIAVREAVRIARRGSREQPVAEADDTPDPGDHELTTQVHDVLRRMPALHREVLVLRELRGLGEQATSELLGVSPGTVKSRLHRARNSFRAAWLR